MENCNGRCIAGVIIAVIFGALFLWTLFFAIKLQWTGAMYSYGTYWYYLLALIFLAVAKGAKWWAFTCPHCRPGYGECWGMEAKPAAKRASKRRKK